MMMINGDAYELGGGAVEVPGYYTEFREFHEREPKPGWAVRNGAVLVNADVDFAGLWAALLDPANAWKLKTEAAWQAMSTTAGGVGGVDYFVLDAEAKTIRLPDTRGDYPRCAGGGTMLNVGDWHGDAIRNITASIYALLLSVDATGIFYRTKVGSGYVPSGSMWSWDYTSMDVSRQVPVAEENRTRAFGLLGCVYVGGN
jgi:hypothetical protein